MLILHVALPAHRVLSTQTILCSPVMAIVRLERFFTSRRKPSSPLYSIDSASSTESSSPVTPAEPQFPSPSFIRPKTSRMTARNEVQFKQSSRTNFSGIDSAEPSIKSQPTLVRPSSFDDNRCDSVFSELYQFPTPPKDHLEQLPLIEDLNLDSIFDSFACDVSSTESESGSMQSSSGSLNDGGLPQLDAVNIQKLVDSLNPASDKDATHSSESFPVLQVSGGEADWDMVETFEGSTINLHLFKDIEHRLERPRSRSSLSRSSSSSDLSQMSVSTSILQEPDFNDFMALSDEDIAEPDVISPLGQIVQPGNAAPAPSPSIPSGLPSLEASRPRSLLTLTPPYASKPAAAAAYEAAKIAAQYDFDLVYIVNLWPDLSRPRSLSMNSEASGLGTMKSSHHMTGRLLAAYGLENVKSPFQISSQVHTKILRSEGWIEYRSQEARSDEFARGYACNFMTGQFSRSNSIDSMSSADAESLAPKVDRGLVFAAYRKPRPDGSLRCSDEAELESLRVKAEALVEMLIDLHCASRQKHTPLFSQHADVGRTPAHNFRFASD